MLDQLVNLSNRSQQVSLSYGWLGAHQSLFVSPRRRRGMFGDVTGIVGGRYGAPNTSMLRPEGIGDVFCL